MNKFISIPILIITLFSSGIAQEPDLDKRKVLFEGLLNNQSILMAYRTSFKISEIYDKNKFNRAFKKKLPVVYDTLFKCKFIVNKVLSGKFKDTILNYASHFKPYDSTGYCFVLESDTIPQPTSGSGFGDLEYKYQYKIGVEESINIMSCFINNTCDQKLNKEELNLINYLKTLKRHKPINSGYLGQCVR
jgi:hypothetical protein